MLTVFMYTPYRVPDSNKSADLVKVADSNKTADSDGVSGKSGASRAVPTVYVEPVVEAKTEEAERIKDTEQDTNGPGPNSNRASAEVKPEARDSVEGGGGEDGAQELTCTPTAVSPTADTAMEEGFTRDTTPLVNGSPLEHGRTLLASAEGGTD